MLCEYTLYLGWVDVQAPGDDQVALSVAEGYESVRVDAGEVARAIPTAVCECLLRRGVIPPVALHHVVAAYQQLTHVPGWNLRAIVADNPQIDASCRAPGAREDALVIASAVVRRSQEGNGMRRFAGAVHLSEDRPEMLDRASKQRRRDRRAAEGDLLHGRHRSDDARAGFEKALEHCRDKKRMGPTLSLDERRERLRVELAEDNVRAAHRQDSYELRAASVRQRSGVHEDAAVVEPELRREHIHC